MTLQFRAPFQIDPNAEDPTVQSLARLNQTVSSVGDDWTRYISSMRERRDKYGDPNAADPNAIVSPDEMASRPVAGPQPEGTVDWSRGAQGPQPAGTLAQPGTDPTARFRAWKQSGMTGGDQSMSRTDAPYVNAYRKRFGSEGLNTLFKSRELQNQDIKTRAEATKDLAAAAGGAGAYTADQIKVLLPGEEGQKLIQAYGGQGIPKDAVHQMMGMVRLNTTTGEKDDQFNKKRLTALGDALDPSKQARGPFGVSKQVYDRAERLESLATAFSDGNLDSRQVEELAIGLNAMLSGSNTGAQAQVAALVPHTVMGNAQKMLEWISNDPRGAQQQAFVQRMMGSIAREKQTAADQIKRTQFERISRYGDLEKSTPDQFVNVLQSQGVDPDEYQEWKKGGHKRMSAVQAPEGGGERKYTQTATNPQTGQKVGWNGEKWVSLQ